MSAPRDAQRRVLGAIAQDGEPCQFEHIVRWAGMALEHVETTVDRMVAGGKLVRTPVGYILPLNDRQVKFLGVLTEKKDDHYLHAGVLAAEAGVPFSGRRDAGATRTLDAMEKRKLVRSSYPTASYGRVWRITREGERVLEAWHLAAQAKDRGLEGITP